MKKKLNVKSFISGVAVGAILFSGIAYATDLSVKLVVDGQEIHSDVSPKIMDGRAVVPARVLAEALGAKVEWDAQNNAIVVTTGTDMNQPTSSAHETPHWSYGGEAGPEKWGSLDSSFTKCTNGTEQSPIDIELSKVKLDKTLENISIKYQPTAFTVVNNGHTIQANASSEGNSILLDGKEYQLVQFHFHKPSENQIDGQSFAMEGHLVHKSSDEQLAVLGFLIKAGKENEQLAEIWSKFPQEMTKQAVSLDQPIDLPNLLPQDKKAFYYAGSLTTPPCSEGVKWIVLQQPIELSSEQIDAFGAIFPNNARPVQPLNERDILTN